MLGFKRKSKNTSLEDSEIELGEPRIEVSQTFYTHMARTEELLLELALLTHFARMKEVEKARECASNLNGMLNELGDHPRRFSYLVLVNSVVSLSGIGRSSEISPSSEGSYL